MDDGVAIGVLVVVGGFVVAVAVAVAVVSCSSLSSLSGLDRVGGALVEVVAETVDVAAVVVVAMGSEGIGERVGVSLPTGVVTEGSAPSVRLGVTVKASELVVDGLGIGVLVVVLFNETEGVGVNAG